MKLCRVHVDMARVSVPNISLKDSKLRYLFFLPHVDKNILKDFREMYKRKDTIRTKKLLCKTEMGRKTRDEERRAQKRGKKVATVTAQRSEKRSASWRDDAREKRY